MESKNYRQIVIARKDLNMSHGKLSSQVSHGSQAFLTNMIRENACMWTTSNDETYYSAELTFDKDLFENWLNGSFTKVVLAAKNKYQLLKAKTMAEQLGMVEGKDFFCIYDACRTELEPEEIDSEGIGRTLTCIGFRPFDEETIKPISRKYQLYK